MSYRNQLIAEIANFCDLLKDEKRDWDTDAITTAIIGQHRDEFKDDAIFTEYNVYSNVKREVKTYISKVAGDKTEQENMQLIMPGFEHLQLYYTVNRYGKNIGVHVDTMTDDELEEKVKIYRKMAKGCEDHATEIERYIKIRVTA